MSIIRTRRIIDDAGAQAVLDAAEHAANDRGARVVIAIVDPWGELVELRRTPGAQVASSRVAVDKARTAAIFVRPSREMEEQVTGGRIGALALHGAACLIGGIPLVVDGEVVGAIGTSGETPDEDEAISIAGAAADFTAADVPALTMFLVRPDQAQVASVKVTTDKAHTAAIYRRPSKDFEDQASGGRPSALHLARAVPLQGGIPIEHDGTVIGAIGVSGATSADEDNELAAIGAAAVQASMASRNGRGNGAAFFPAAAVVKQFESGGLLLDAPGYKIDAGRPRPLARSSTTSTRSMSCTCSTAPRP